MKTLDNNGKKYFVIAVILMIFFHNYWFDAFLQKFNFFNTEVNHSNQDFLVYYAAGHALLTGADPYQSPLPVANNVFLYPPTFLPIYSLFSLLDYDFARYLFLFLNLAIFGATLLLLMKYSAQQERNPTLLAGLAALLFSAPFLDNSKYGQIDLIVACLIFAGLLFYLNSHKNLSALLLAAAVLFKVNPILLLATFVLFFGDWKYLLRFSIAAGGLVLLSLIFMKPNLYLVYVTDVLPRLTVTPQASYTNQSPLRWLVNKDIPFFPNIDKKMVMKVYLYAGMLILAGFAWVAGKRIKKYTSEIRTVIKNPETRFIAYAFFLLNISATLLLSSRVWVHAYVWFILPIVPILIFAYKRVRFRLFCGISLGAFCVLAQVLNQPNVLNWLNLLGSVIFTLCVSIIIIFPDFALRQDTFSEKNPQNSMGA